MLKLEEKNIYEASKSSRARDRKLSERPSGIMRLKAARAPNVTQNYKQNHKNAP